MAGKQRNNLLQKTQMNNIDKHLEYIDDILIIIDQNKTDGKTILTQMNNIDRHLEFKLLEEENNNINYLDLSVRRNTNSIDLGIYRKPTHTDITIQFSSNHPCEHKLAPFNFYLNRLLVLPITKQVKQQEWKIILAIAQNSGFPLHIIHNLKKKLIAKKTKTKTPNHNNTTTQKMGNIHISQSTNTKNNKSLQTLT
jgi:hypothetical protein